MRIGQQFEEKIAPNIALIKYWGKLEKYLNIPLNGSVSLTLDKSCISSKCKSELQLRSESTLNDHQFNLFDMDNVLIETTFHKKFPLIQNFFISEFIKDHKFDGEKSAQFRKDFSQYIFIIEARNTFPSSAGLASSASGACALVLSISRIFNYFQESESESSASLTDNIFSWITTNNQVKVLKLLRLCTLLRIVSGSSSRSLYPGLVFLSGIQHHRFKEAVEKVAPQGKFQGLIDLAKMGSNPDNRLYFKGMLERYAKAFEEKTAEFPPQCENENDYLRLGLDYNDRSCAFPYFFAQSLSVPQGKPETFSKICHKELSKLEKFFGDLKIMILIFKKEKKKVSSTGGMIDSSLTSENLRHRVSRVPDTLEALLSHMEGGDKGAFLRMIMKDSNNFHSVCLDTTPPIFYLNSQSITVINAIHDFNSKRPDTEVAYTFDAGCNPFILFKKSSGNELKGIFKGLFGSEILQIVESEINMRA